MLSTIEASTGYTHSDATVSLPSLSDALGPPQIRRSHSEMFPIGASTDALLPLEPERWLLVDREGLSRVAMGGDVRLRIDQSPIRFGNYILECLRDADLAKECCGACNAPLRMYFRVGSQQLCPACTERFKGETLESNARTFRRALRDGIVAAAAGGLTHSFLLNFAQPSPQNIPRVEHRAVRAGQFVLPLIVRRAARAVFDDAALARPHAAGHRLFE